MRITILGVVVVALTAAADDDYYQRQAEQRRFDQQQDDNRIQAQRMESQRIDAQRFEQQRQQLSDERRMQDRVDQEQTDERWDRQQAERRDIIERNAATQRRNNDAMMQQALNLGLQRARNKAARADCAELRLPREQTVELDFTGYWEPEGTKPYFMTAMGLGSKGTEGRLAFTAHIRDGDLPTKVKNFDAELTLYIPQASGKSRLFKGVSGSAKFPKAERLTARGQFVAELTDVLLVEMDGWKERVGGSCIRASTLRLSANWTRSPVEGEYFNQPAH